MNHRATSAPVAEQSAWPRFSWIVALLVLTVGYRIGAASSEALWNTAPLMAMCFGGGLILGWRFCWVPAFLLFFSDLFLGLSHGTGVGFYTISSGLIYTLVAISGALIGSRSFRGSWLVMLTGTLTASLIFYGLGNTFAWLTTPQYAKSFAGWWQSQTIGLPGYPPSVLFLRNALIGDTIWCVLAAPLFFWKPVAAAQQERVENRLAPAA